MSNETINKEFTKGLPDESVKQVTVNLIINKDIEDINTDFLSNYKEQGEVRIDCDDLETLYVRGGHSNKQTLQFATSSVLDLYSVFMMDNNNEYYVQCKVNVQGLFKHLVALRKELPFVIECSASLLQKP